MNSDHVYSHQQRRRRRELWAEDEYWSYSINDDLESFSIGQLVVPLLTALVAIALMLPIVVAAFMTLEANDWFLPTPNYSAVRDACPSIADHQTE